MLMALRCYGVISHEDKLAITRSGHAVLGLACDAWGAGQRWPRRCCVCVCCLHADVRSTTLCDRQFDAPFQSTWGGEIWSRVVR